MTPERRTEIESQVDEFERIVKRREAAYQADRQVVEQLVHDCEALFVHHPSGERLLVFLEKYFCGAPKPATLMKKTAENAMKFTAKCEGNREVVEFLRKMAKGAVKVTDAA